MSGKGPGKTTRGALGTGKLPTPTLDQMLKRYASPSPGSGVLVGPAVGLDSAVLDINGRGLVAKTDPVTFVADDIGTYSIHVNANDIAVMNGTARWFLSTILLPAGRSTAAEAERIFRQIDAACREIGVAVAGGHTETTTAVNTPVVVGSMLGTVDPASLVTGAGAVPGDCLILTKGLAIEGTSIIARTRGTELVDGGAFSSRFIARCRNLIKKPGISVIGDVRALTGSARVHAMHDPTEGGISAAVNELAIASKCGIIIDRGALMVLPETAMLCEHFNIDPLALIASGALLAAIDPRDRDKALAGLSTAGIKASVIGRVTEKGRGVVMEEGGKERRLPMPEADEITRV